MTDPRSRRRAPGERAGRAALPALVLCFAALGGPASARPFLCLPPVFESGQRLHPAPNLSTLWLELLLRQHEVCWRRPAVAHEARIFVIGSSSVYGFPLPVEQSFVTALNQQFTRHDVPAHAFNLASLGTYQVRDALILRAALPYAPDIIVYPLTLSEFAHLAPVGWGHIDRFILTNAAPLLALAADPDTGLSEPLGIYRSAIRDDGMLRSGFERIREIGKFVRAGAERNAEAVAQWLLPGWKPKPRGRSVGRRTKYDCKKTQEKADLRWNQWPTWNVLEYLHELQTEQGIDVLVVNWPVAHEPVGECYNVRFPSKELAAYNAWITQQTRALGLRFLDLQRALPPEEFLDSVHVGPEGHRRIALRLGEELDRIVAERQARATAAGGGRLPGRADGGHPEERYVPGGTPEPAH